jgi:hypothetical protein
VGPIAPLALCTWTEHTHWRPPLVAAAALLVATDRAGVRTLPKPTHWRRRPTRLKRWEGGSMLDMDKYRIQDSIKSPGVAAWDLDLSLLLILLTPVSVPTGRNKFVSRASDSWLISTKNIFSATSFWAVPSEYNLRRRWRNFLAVVGAAKSGFGFGLHDKLVYTIPCQSSSSTAFWRDLCSRLSWSWHLWFNCRSLYATVALEPSRFYCHGLPVGTWV